MAPSTITQLAENALELLQELIRTTSFSKEESATATIIQDFLQAHNIPNQRFGNNILALNKNFDASKPTILLNSHHDTVKPNPSYTRDPFQPSIEAGKLYGLGSNDAGGCLVALIACFRHYYTATTHPYNIILAATAEEEISGSGGVESLLPHLPKIDFAIVGEPTLLQMAVAERGLMVLDCVSTGIAGHAARNEGDNALYKALNDIARIQNYRWEKNSDLLGPTKATVTVIETVNKAHNVVPDTCRFVIDTRINENYSFEEVIDLLQAQLSATITPRSMRLRSTAIPLSHPIVAAGLAMGKTYYGSPTTSDKALMPFVALKMGPGDSARSHTADEFIYIEEIHQGVADYIEILAKLK